MIIIVIITVNYYISLSYNTTQSGLQHPVACDFQHMTPNEKKKSGPEAKSPDVFFLSLGRQSSKEVKYLGHVCGDDVCSDDDVGCLRY